MSVLPIVTYNSDMLRQKASPVTSNSDELQELIDEMFETMYNASGVGLAAPQIGRSIRLFIVDTEGIAEDDAQIDAGPMVFINPEIVQASEDAVKLEEGCLSIPDVRDDVSRPEHIVIHYLDADFNKQELKADGWLARVILHETDHLDGVLFLDHLSPFRRRMHQSKLTDIDKGRLDVDYPVTINLK